MAAAADKDRHFRADVDGLAALVDVAIVPKAHQLRAGVGVEPRGIARLDADNPARELLLANDLGHAPVEHELDTFLPRAEFQTAREGGAVPDRPRSGELAAVSHDAWREMAGALALNARVLLRDGSFLDVGLVTKHQERRRTSRARDAAGRVGAVDTREADVVVDQELSGAVAIVSPGAMQIAVIVAVGRLRRDVEDRPVGHVPEQEVSIFPKLVRLVQRRDLDEAFLVAFARDVSQLHRVAAAERDLRSAVQHLAANVEVLINNEHAQAGIPRPDGAGQSGRPRTDNDKVCFIVPLDAIDGGPLRRRLANAGAEGGRADASHRAVREEIAPADGFFAFGLRLFGLAVALPGHVFSP